MKTTQVFLMISAFLGATSAMAGDKIGNGGGVWTCRDNATSALRTAVLVDTFEGRREFGLDIPNYSGLSVEALIDSVERKIFQANRDYYSEFGKQLGRVRNIIRLVSDVQLKVIDDALYRSSPAPETCPGGKIAYEQLANYTEDGIVLVDKRIWDSGKLSVVDMAGLFVHEAIYALLREKENVTNSVKARKLVGHLLSTTSVSDYAHLLTITPPAPATPPPGSREYQMGLILAQAWSFMEGSTQVILRAYKEDENTLKVYQCDPKHFMPTRTCRYLQVEFYRWNSTFNGFVNLGSSGRRWASFGLKLSMSDTRVLYHFYDPLLLYRATNSGEFLEARPVPRP